MFEEKVPNSEDQPVRALPPDLSLVGAAGLRADSLHKMTRCRRVRCTGSVLYANISSLENGAYACNLAPVNGGSTEVLGVSKLKEARQQLRQANRKLAKQQEEIAALRGRLAKLLAGDEVEGIKPENIVWVFGSGRTGSTWLSQMMQALPDHARWNEPTVGFLFGHLFHNLFGDRYYDRELPAQDRDKDILGGGFRETWLNSIRRLVLDGANARFHEVAEKGGYLVIKEPWGSIGAPLLMEALPESRMIFLVRDPRDVVVSKLHVTFVRRGTSAEVRQRAEERPEEFVREAAKIYLQNMNLTKQAYEGHDGRKVLVRYEDLKADTLGTMKRIYSALNIPVKEGELARAVEKYAIENIPEDKKGPGTVRRRATSGGWKEDLTPEQVEIVERITAPVLEEFYV